jgi:uncharacterized protein (UPF0332 family)
MAFALLHPEGGDESLKDKVKVLLERADSNLQAAKLLFNEGFNDAAISRAYYSMYYATEAILLTKKLKFSSHKGVISQFGLNFVKNGPLPSDLGRDLNNAFQDRSLGDYGFDLDITTEMVDESILRAEKFIIALKKYLSEEGYEI